MNELGNFDFLNHDDELLVRLAQTAEICFVPDTKNRSAIIHRNKIHWRDSGLLDFLIKLSNGKCWYTEAKFTAEYPQLEHFRPKSHA